MCMSCRVCNATTNEMTIKHGKTTRTCILCSQQRKAQDYCEHDTRYHDCRLCRDARGVSAMMWYKITTQDKADFTADDLLDMAQANQCYYCKCILQYETPHVPDFATLERLDNSIRHLRGNCVVACFKCNVMDKVSLKTNKT